MSEDTGNAPDNGEQRTEEPRTTPPKSEPGNVPYARFQEVVEQRKGLEATLNTLIDGLVQELPEDMRDLVPNLPPAEKAAWIRHAQQRGLFAKAQADAGSSPDAKRPGGKQPQDYSGMSPLQKMQAGYAAK
jgi:hypothetical protein